MAREGYGVVFQDERTLEIDAEATKRMREELRASRNLPGSLTRYFEERPVERPPNPVSVAGDREFGRA